jgi:rhodanese-related sulfurtransferase
MAADDTDDLGYTNIRVYAAEFPDWFRKGQPYVVSAEHLAKLIASEEVAHIYDLRPAPDYRSGHLPAAHYLPAALFESLSPGVLPNDKEAVLLFYGDAQAARQSYDAAMKAAALGHRHVMLLEGGYQAWEQLSR